MGKYIHWFDKERTFEREYWGDNYKEPWVSFTDETDEVHFGPRSENEAKWKQPLTFDIVTNGTLTWKHYGSDWQRTLQYKLNDGEWTNLTSTTSGVVLNLQRGDSIQFKGDSTVYSHNQFVYNNGGYSDSGSHYYCRFSSTCEIDLSGNLTSLINSTDYNVSTLETDAFSCFFQNCKIRNAKDLKINVTNVGKRSCFALFKNVTTLISAPDLTAENVGEMGFSDMFYGCTKLKNCPNIAATTLGRCAFYQTFSGSGLTNCCKILPATTLSEQCYYGMFNGCSFEEVPSLPATTLASNCYKTMFKDCKNIKEPPTLIATTLAEGCYSAMFSGCENLQHAPELIATTLAPYCYNSMFYNCKTIETPPELNAANMESNCYSSMFDGCSKLQYAPELSSVNLASNCYRGMFRGCSSITNPPLLPATILFTGCYQGMFESCSKLEEMPDLLSTYLAENCYYRMFCYCRKITTIKPLSATTLASGCYWQMFYGCENLTTTVALPATTLAPSCYKEMFYNCSNLTTALPLPATTLAESCYEKMFYGCELLTSLPTHPSTVTSAKSAYNSMFGLCNSLTSIPQDYFSGISLSQSCFSSMFYKCTGLTSLPSGLLPNTQLETSCYSSMFSNCSNLTSIPSGLLPATTLAQSCYYAMFYSSGITSIPEGFLPATIMQPSCYYGMFQNCQSLTSIPMNLLPATTLANNCYYYMFCSCSELLNGCNLPATTLSGSCYYSMFYGCTKLKTTGVLAAETLASDCCYSMFQGCSSLTTAPELNATTYVSNAYCRMFYSCSNLRFIKCLLLNSMGSSYWTYNVSKTGVFVKNNNVGESVWTAGQNGIPEGWITTNGLYITNGLSQEIDSKQQTITLTGGSVNPWTITSDSNWLTVSPASGSGTINASLNVSKNSGSFRVANVTLTDGTDTLVIVVEQYSEDMDGYERQEQYLFKTKQNYIDFGVIVPEGSSEGWLKINYTNLSNNGSGSSLSPHLWITDATQSYGYYAQVYSSLSQTSTSYNSARRAYMRVGYDYPSSYTYNSYAWTGTVSEGTSYTYSYILLENEKYTIRIMPWAGYKYRQSTHYNLVGKHVRLGGYRGPKSGGRNFSDTQSSYTISTIEINPYNGAYQTSPAILYPYKEIATDKMYFISKDGTLKYEVKIDDNTGW